MPAARNRRAGCWAEEETAGEKIHEEKDLCLALSVILSTLSKAAFNFNRVSLGQVNKQNKYHRVEKTDAEVISPHRRSGWWLIHFCKRQNLYSRFLPWNAIRTEEN